LAGLDFDHSTGWQRPLWGIRAAPPHVFRRMEHSGISQTLQISLQTHQAYLPRIADIDA